MTAFFDMKLFRRPALLIKFTGMVLLLFFASCTDGSDLSDFLGEDDMPASVLAQPRVVSVPTAEALADKTYPRLGDVPSKPKDFTAQPTIDATMRELFEQRQDGIALRQEYQPALAPMGEAAK